MAVPAVIRPPLPINLEAVAYNIADTDMIETLGPKLAEGARAERREEWRIAILEKWREEIAYEAAIDEEGASGNHTKKADTFAELALKMKIDPRTFVETMERYNSFCEKGKDLDFGKPAQMLKPIPQASFLCVFRTSLVSMYKRQKRHMCKLQI